MRVPCRLAGSAHDVWLPAGCHRRQRALHPHQKALARDRQQSVDAWRQARHVSPEAAKPSRQVTYGEGVSSR